LSGTKPLKLSVFSLYLREYQAQIQQEKSIISGKLLQDGRIMSHFYIQKESTHVALRLCAGNTQIFVKIRIQKTITLDINPPR
jgi:hypothetical protein